MPYYTPTRLSLSHGTALTAPLSQTLSEPYLAVERGVEHGRVVAIQAELLGDV